MSDQDNGPSPSGNEPAESWDTIADQAHLDGQALLDALERRVRRLGRRVRRPRDAPPRILRLMD